MPKHVALLYLEFPNGKPLSWLTFIDALWSQANKLTVLSLGASILGCSQVQMIGHILTVLSFGSARLSLGASTWFAWLPHACLGCGAICSCMLAMTASRDVQVALPWWSSSRHSVVRSTKMQLPCRLLQYDSVPWYTSSHVHIIYIRGMSVPANPTGSRFQSCRGAWCGREAGHCTMFYFVPRGSLQKPGIRRVWLRLLASIPSMQALFHSSLIQRVWTNM